MEQIYHIYDRIFKRIFALSDLAIINLINGIFDTNYPPDSKVTYPNKEMVGRKLDKIFADLFIVINEDTYHVEAQMTEDETIVMRVFEYSFYHALETRRDESILKFAEPAVIYLDTTSNVSEESILTLDFGTQGSFRYKVRNFLYQEQEVVELNRRKMIILISFQLLKLRRLIQKHPTQKNFDQLKSLIENDILDSIKANLRVGNITQDDANQLKELTRQLYDHIYMNYEKLGGYLEMKQLLDGAIELPLDKYRIRIDELEAENQVQKKEKQKAEAEKQKAETEKQKAEAEILRLKQRIKELENK